MRIKFPDYEYLEGRSLAKLFTKLLSEHQSSHFTSSKPIIKK